MDPETKKLLGEILKELKALNKKTDKLIEAAENAASMQASGEDEAEERRIEEHDRRIEEKMRRDGTI
ncbi:MAG: hypothetical protein SF051_05405 [Elusimicrobiota bacterium]|nr:hypothetical protein [Elusimicrobiota bacterium]